MASVSINRESVIAAIKESLTSQMAALRELGIEPEQIAQMVFAASMAAGSRSGPGSVADDDKPKIKSKATKAPKKAKDPEAPKKPMNAGLADYNARFDAWWEENKARLEAEWESHGKAYEIVQAHHEAKVAEYEAAKEKAESKGKELKKSEPRGMPTKMSKPTAKVIFSELPEQKERKAAAAEVSKSKTKEKAAAKKASKAGSVASAGAETAAAADESQDEEDWTPIVKNGKNYIYNDQGHCYLFIDGEQGPWAGIYDAETDILDDTIAEPWIQN